MSSKIDWTHEKATSNSKARDVHSSGSYIFYSKIFKKFCVKWANGEATNFKTREAAIEAVEYHYR